MSYKVRVVTGDLKGEHKFDVAYESYDDEDVLEAIHYVFERFGLEPRNVLRVEVQPMERP